MSSEEDLKRYAKMGANGLIAVSALFLVAGAMLVTAGYFLKEPKGFDIASKVFGGFSITFALLLIAAGIFILSQIDEIVGDGDDETEE